MLEHLSLFNVLDMWLHSMLSVVNVTPATCVSVSVCYIFRYFLRASVIRRLNDITKEMDIVVHTLSTYPELNSSIKMEVGIEDCLHIEFEYNKSK